MGKNCEFCAQWQEHCYWSHMPDENKHFFKLMARDFTEGVQTHLDVKDNKDHEMDDGEAAAKSRYYFCKNGPVSEFHLTEEDKEEISSVAVPVEPRNPVFATVLHPSHVRSTTRTSILGVSSEFAGKYLGAVGREIVLRRTNSKGRWNVRYASGENSRGISGRGWRDFTRDNGLLAHDICLFELLEGARRPAATVHVLRKVHGRFVLVP